jgi:hypothetical protein
MRGRRALPDGRLAALGASPPFLKWVLVGALLLASTAAARSNDRAAFTNDRIVAERVLRLGGAVILDGQRTAIRDLDDLPAAISTSAHWISSASRWAPGD